MEKFREFLPIVATLLTAVLGAAGVFLQEWRQKRDDRHQRKQARAEATEMVAFVEKWIQTQQLTCSPEEFEQVKQTARQQLEHIYSSLLMQEAKKPVEERSFIQRALLLYKPASLGGWVLHLIFYVLGAIILLWGVLIAFILLEASSGSPIAPNDPPLGILIFVLIIYYFFLFVTALAVRAWAVVIDKKHHNQQANAIPISHENRPPDSLPFILARSDELEDSIPTATQFQR